MSEEELKKKLTELRARLVKLEGEEVDKITKKRILADMGDDYRENEGAKLVMEDHEFLHMRIADLKKEMLTVKKRLIVLKSR
jgi:hypothetical protein